MSGTRPTEKESGLIYANIDTSDPEMMETARELFPSLELRPYTLRQRIGHRWARFVHRFGRHTDVLTLRAGVDHGGEFEEQPVVIGSGTAMVIASQYECQVCHRRTGSPKIKGYARP